MALLLAGRTEMKQGAIMEQYETPTIEELGTVAEFTQGNIFADGSDNRTFFGFTLGS
jgi:hypothetical protein